MELCDVDAVSSGREHNMVNEYCLKELLLVKCVEIQLLTCLKMETTNSLPHSMIFFSY